MSEYGPERPAAVTVIGWGSIVLAVLMLLSGLAGLATAALIQMTWSQVGMAIPSGYEEMTGLLQYTVPLSLLQLGIAVVMMVASILLLRLRESGRLMLEALNWFGLVFTIGVAAWLMPAWSRAVARAAQALPGQQAGGALVFGPTMAASIGVVQVVIIAVIIWVLRSKTVRSAMVS